MNRLYGWITRLIEINCKQGLVEPMDEVYIRNRILADFKMLEFEDVPAEQGDLYETLDALANYAVSMKCIEDTSAQRDNFTSRLMNLFLDKPSVVNHKFGEKYKVSKKDATDYFYNLSQLANYIKVDRIAKNMAFTTQSPYGDMQITINLSKPEKDPKEIARMKSAPPNKYPPCLLCIENEGYEGTITLPDRANHRMIRLNLNNSDWMLQYSPYLYYNEHCIVLSKEHQPMKITKNTFETLIDFTSQFPHYFIGSNADLPIVGGSILSHEHYQGGSHKFPIDNAKERMQFQLEKYPTVSGAVLNWPLTTIELRSVDKKALLSASELIFENWKKYSDSECDIFAFTDEVPHNTITPICKRDGEDYVMRLVLRNNRTSEEHPLGIFHPHEDVHHIKKENIGLIEVMGLAILPGRLLNEIELIKAFVLGQEVEVPKYHLEWANLLRNNYKDITPIDSYIKQAIGDKFTRVLEDAGVYKLTEKGAIGIKRFIDSIC
ncbi:MAG: UDP-glucose--hexose-1-phosphate uridylyltransferase [Cellulosilyticaceae bacterium]